MPFNPYCTEFLTSLFAHAQILKRATAHQMEDSPLPTPEAVLDKVKSDGTFDQFRKTCLAAVEAEVRQ